VQPPAGMPPPLIGGPSQQPQSATPQEQFQNMMAQAHLQQQQVLQQEEWQQAQHYLMSQQAEVAQQQASMELANQQATAEQNELFAQRQHAVGVAAQQAEQLQQFQEYHAASVENIQQQAMAQIQQVQQSEMQQQQHMAMQQQAQYQAQQAELQQLRQLLLASQQVTSAVSPVGLSALPSAPPSIGTTPMWPQAQPLHEAHFQTVIPDTPTRSVMIGEQSATEDEWVLTPNQTRRHRRSRLQLEDEEDPL
jgi:hypothetical protein